jgi:cyclopropane fatty-acyl-phospholipid synthase-like methyltransferase
MFNELREINRKPRPFERYTAEELWTDEYTRERMLEFHLDQTIDAASRSMEFIDKSARWIIEHFKLATGSAVIDFGCGPGLYALRLAKSGASVTGIDFSENSLAYARGKAAESGVSIDYIHANYLEYQTDRTFDLITMIMCDYTALGPSQRRTLLEKFRRLLNPGGAVLLDVYSHRYFHKTKERAAYGFNYMDRFWSADDYYCFHTTFKYEEEKLLLDRYSVYTEELEKHIYNWAQCFDRDTITGEFAASGLRITEFYADVSGEAHTGETDVFAIVAGRE